ncbi:MAG: class I SAM-dependent methyltransferase [Candidatus Sulfotelmatobacter sp.]|jgi:SAM-dependent methyltransferase
MDGSNGSASASPRIGLSRSVLRWWRDLAAREGRVSATRRLLNVLAEFVRDSTPQRRRQRYGDADYDWDHRVNTTSAAVCWRDRLLGVFHSPYQPTESVLFHEMIQALGEHARIDLSEFVFVDLGSGKGRTLLMASDYPFRRIVGVELLPALHETAKQNLSVYCGESQKCFVIESICGDATQFSFPAEPTVLFLFNPFPESGMRNVIANLERSVRAHPRAVYVLYHNPLLERVLGESMLWKKICGTHQYAVYASG